MANYRVLRRLLGPLSRGFTLVEALAAVTLTTLVALVVSSVLLSVMSSSRRLQEQTDQFESIRLAATMMQQDARFATSLSCAPAMFLTLYTNHGGITSIKYVFEDGNGNPDYNHLHRLAYNGGNVVRDDIVGWNLLHPDYGGTDFGCIAYSSQRQATIRFVKPPLAGQLIGAELQVTAFLR